MTQIIKSVNTIINKFWPSFKEFETAVECSVLN